MSNGQAPFEESALTAMLSLLDEGVLFFEGSDLVCVKASARATEILGGVHTMGLSRHSLFGAISGGDEAATRALAALRDVEPAETRRETIALKGDPPRFLSWFSAPILNGGNVIGRLDVLGDRTVERELRRELERAYDKVAETTLFDELTGLANRKHFETEIDREHRRSQRSWASYAVARIDVDDMGKLNADIGREAADQMFRRVGEVLKGARREYDLVGRWENDELIVLLPGIDERSVKQVLLRSLSAMSDAAREIAARPITFCTGVGVWIPPSVETANDVITRAGIALEAAKLSGRGNMEIDARMVEWKEEG